MFKRRIRGGLVASSPVRHDPIGEVRESLKVTFA